jgi:hypothetical protein
MAFVQPDGKREGKLSGDDTEKRKHDCADEKARHGLAADPLKKDQESIDPADQVCQQFLHTTLF